MDRHRRYFRHVRGREDSMTHEDAFSAVKESCSRFGDNPGTITDCSNSDFYVFEWPVLAASDPLAKRDGPKGADQ